MYLNELILEQALSHSFFPFSQINLFNLGTKLKKIYSRYIKKRKWTFKLSNFLLANSIAQLSYFLARLAALNP